MTTNHQLDFLDAPPPVTPKKSFSTIDTLTTSRRSSTTPLADRFMNHYQAEEIDLPKTPDCSTTTNDQSEPLSIYDQQYGHHPLDPLKRHCHCKKKRRIVKKKKMSVAIEMPLEAPKKRSCCFIVQQRRKCFCFCGRREWVIVTFLCVLLSVVFTFVFWPRTPLIRIEGASLTQPTQVTQTQFHNSKNVALTSSWLLNVTMDNRRNYLSTRFNKIHLIAKDAFTGLLIGKGLGEETIYIAGHTISQIQLPISINYQARDSSDTTFSNLERACKSHYALSVQFWFTLYIFGLDWVYKPSVIATPATGGFYCPY